MKPVIIAILGLSGSGKTYMAQYIEEAFNIRSIVSFTTRPMRVGEINGKEHYFVSESEIPPKKEMIAYTLFGGYHYWACKSQVIAPLCSYVIDEKGYEELQERFSDTYRIIPVLLHRPQSSMETIDKKRRDRDDGRINLYKISYDFTINNSGTIEDLEEKIDTIISNIKTKY